MIDIWDSAVTGRRRDSFGRVVSSVDFMLWETYSLAPSVHLYVCSLHPLVLVDPGGTVLGTLVCIALCTALLICSFVQHCVCGHGFRWWRRLKVAAFAKALKHGPFEETVTSWVGSFGGVPW